MPQFTVYRNTNPRTEDRFPFLLDVQADLLSDLGTRVVVPLARASAARKPIDRLTPIVEVAGEPYMLVTPQLAGIGVNEVGPAVSTLAPQRAEILGALDFLITGS